MIAMLLLVLLLVSVKLLLPELAAGLRLKLSAALERDTDYVAVFEDLGKRFSLSREPARETPGPQSLPAVNVAARPAAKRAGYISYAVEEALPAGAAELPPSVLTPAPEPEPEKLPAAVAAFLEQQAAYADHALPENVDCGYDALPFEYALPVSGYSSSGFGYRLHPILNIVRFHFGTDVAAGAGTEVLAFADGTVRFSGYDESYGYHLILDHGDGWETLYAHCGMLYASEGERVEKGTCVALVGSSGLATGPHLHFELSRDGVYRNPEYYING